MAAAGRKEKIEKKIEKSTIPCTEKLVKSLQVLRNYLPKTDPIPVPADSELGKEYLVNGSVPSFQWIIDDMIATVEDLEVGLKNALQLAGKDTEWNP